MNAIVFVAIVLCAGCAHTSTRPTETDELASNILSGDSRALICAQDAISSCELTTRATYSPRAQARERCECVPKNLFDAPLK